MSRSSKIKDHDREPPSCGHSSLIHYLKTQTSAKGFTVRIVCVRSTELTKAFSRSWIKERMPCTFITYLYFDFFPGIFLSYFYLYFLSFFNKEKGERERKGSLEPLVNLFAVGLLAVQGDTSSNCLRVADGCKHLLSLPS